MRRNGRGEKPIWGCWVQSITSLGRYYDHRTLQLLRYPLTGKKIAPLISRRYLGRNRRNVNHKSTNLSTTRQARRKEDSISLFSAIPIHIFHLFLLIHRLFAGEKLSFGGSKLWFDGSKLSFGATKQNPFLPPTRSIASTVSILWMRRQQIFCFRPQKNSLTTHTKSHKKTHTKE